MDLRTKERIKLEKLLRRMHRERQTDLQALNILNLDSSCYFNLYKHSPKVYSSISSLKEKVKHIKRTFDELGLDDYSSKSHTSLSSYNHIIRGVPETLVHNTKKNFVEDRRKKKFSKRFSKEILTQNVKLVKRMNTKIKFLLDENPLNYYITHVIRDCDRKKWRISKDMEHAETQLRRFLRVCDFFPPKFEVPATDSKSLKHYSLFANLLKLCYNLDLQDSDIVIKIFLILLKMHPTNSETLSPVGHPEFPKEILKFILFHACKTKTNLQFYISSYFNTNCSFSRNFSVLESVANGDEEMVLQLLNAGFYTFPEEEQEVLWHKFPNISEVLPKTHKIILSVMEKIRLLSLSTTDKEAVTVNEDQQRCFRKFCRYFMTTYVSKKELKRSISAYYEYLLSNGTEEELCLDRNRRLVRLAILYADNFTEPRTLQDLSKISLRRSFENVKETYYPSSAASCPRHA